MGLQGHGYDGMANLNVPLMYHTGIDMNGLGGVFR
jgi:hypothetical protein